MVLLLTRSWLLWGEGFGFSYRCRIRRLRLISEVFGQALNGPRCGSLGSEPKSLRIGLGGHVTEGGMASSISWSATTSEKRRRLPNYRSVRD